MRKIILVLILLLIVSNVQAGLFKSIFGSKDTKIDKIEKQIKTTNTKLGVIEKAVAQIGVDISAFVQGQAGVNNKIVNETKKMRDEVTDIKTDINITKTSMKQIRKNVNQSNQASIFIVGFIAQTIIIIFLVGALFWLFAKSMERKKYIIKYEKELDKAREEGKL